MIVVDARGLAGLVTSAVVPSWRENNFGLRLLSGAVSADAITAEIDRYDPIDARLASDFIRRTSSLEQYLARLEEMHREVIAESAARPIDTDALPYRMGQATRALATAQDAQNEVEWANAARARELELRMEFHACAIAREAELRAEFQIQASKREADFQAYRDWVAPRNVGRRIMHKVRRVLSRT